MGVTFNGATLEINNITFNSSCVPTAYDLTLNGSAALLEPSGATVSVMFSQLDIHIDNGANGTTLTVDGGLSASCFGGTANLTTSTPLAIPAGQDCPTAGVITAAVPSGTATITFGAGRGWL